MGNSCKKNIIKLLDEAVKLHLQDLVTKFSKRTSQKLFPQFQDCLQNIIQTRSSPLSRALSLLGYISSEDSSIYEGSLLHLIVYFNNVVWLEEIFIACIYTSFIISIVISHTSSGDCCFSTTQCI
jgi:hypothetical protein